MAYHQVKEGKLARKATRKSSARLFEGQCHCSDSPTPLTTLTSSPLGSYREKNLIHGEISQENIIIAPKDNPVKRVSNETTRSYLSARFLHGQKSDLFISVIYGSRSLLDLGKNVPPVGDFVGVG